MDEAMAAENAVAELVAVASSAAAQKIIKKSGAVRRLQALLGAEEYPEVVANATAVLRAMGEPLEAPVLGNIANTERADISNLTASRAGVKKMQQAAKEKLDRKREAEEQAAKEKEERKRNAAEKLDRAKAAAGSPRQQAV